MTPKHQSEHKGKLMELTLGEKLRELRESQGLTQTELGKMVKMTQRKISHIEANHCEPSIEDIRAFCKVFNVSADYLVGITNSPRPTK